MAAAGLAAPGARADACGIPDSGPIWVDYGGHDAPLPVKPGMILAMSSGTEVPSGMRAKGAATVFFDLNFNKRIGTTVAPADPATIPARAKGLYDFAVTVTGCEHPILAMNELFGAQTPTPWSASNAQYRANALLLFQELQKLGARPGITIANPPYIGGEAADWWREAAKAAILIRQVYFTAPNTNGLYKLGAEKASRTMRRSLRSLVARFTQLGIPANRVALELQFQSAPSALNVANPHDQMPCTPNSRATCLAASASHLSTCSHAFRGANLRAPPSGADWNWSSSATRFAGIPSWVKRATSERRLRRIVRLAFSAPSL